MAIQNNNSIEEYLISNKCFPRDFFADYEIFHKQNDTERFQIKPKDEGIFYIFQLVEDIDVYPKFDLIILSHKDNPEEYSKLYSEIKGMQSEIKKEYEEVHFEYIGETILRIFQEKILKLKNHNL